jgi:protein-S-isoprenylcysteine O-methyltransferase Ste14
MSRVIMPLIWVAFLALVGGIIFVSAGRLDLPMVWGVLGVLAVFCMLMITSIDPALMRERMRPGAGNCDRLTRPATFVLLLGHWIIAGLDVGRFHWSPIPFEVQLAGLIGYAVAMAGAFWAIRANPFYSSAVRLQTDRGQRPITGGPYRFVRHPGYAATVFGMVSGGLALGSWIAMLPVVAVVALFVRRTLVEDRMLRTGLAGYADYANRVRFRLVAGVF